MDAKFDSASRNPLVCRNVTDPPTQPTNQLALKMPIPICILTERGGRGYVSDLAARDFVVAYPIRASGWDGRDGIGDWDNYRLGYYTVHQD